MPSKADIDKLFRRYLGREAADILLAKIEKMRKQGKSAAKIEKMIESYVSSHIANEIVSAVVSKVGPIAPETKGGVNVNVRSRLVAYRKIEPCISVKAKS
jgi:hypothetical protein